MAYILRWSVKKEKIGIHMAGNHNEIEKHLWDAADELRANSKLKSSEYSVPVLGMIFLGKFAMTEGQKGGEFFTPTSIVKLIVEVIEPYHGCIFDPACG